ncbi:MAG TPA: tetratricopeptide repeat protein [Nitrospirae bacterium]|nr:tetratricopeptide repeat protein [Nitrospirota bacterium]
MALEDIEKLKARIEKDPESKLFVPLAEEYRKAAMYEEAVDILLRGLEKEAGYTSARVALGKIYLEQGEVDDAREEFEKVIKSIPDNLFAQKKLAEIYRDTGNKDKAVEHYRKVMELNPFDDEAKAILDKEDSATELKEPETGGGVSTPEDEQEPEPVSFDGVVLPGEEGAEVVRDEPLSESEEETSVSEEAFEIPDPEPAGESVNIDYEEYKEFSRFIDEQIHDPEGEDIFELEDVPELELSEGSDSPSGPEIVEKEEESLFSFSSLQEEAEEAMEETEGNGVDKLIAEADEYVRGDRYVRAIEMYADLLSDYPDDLRVRQWSAELKQLLSILGKDTGALVGRMESMLDGLQKRKDEFLRDS